MPGEGVLDLAIDQGPKWLDQHMAVRGLKAATYPFRSSGDYQGYDFAELDGPGFNGDGFRSRAFVPAQFTKQPELFWGPFMQLGTYLKGQGVIDSDGVALALDIAVDPTNLLAAGSFGLVTRATKGALGLTESAKAARLFTALSKAGEIKDAGKAIDAGLHALEEGWKLSGFRDELLAAAKAGDKGAVKKIVDAARATGRLSDEQSQLLSALRKDRGLLKNVFGHVNEFHGKMFQAGDLRQAGVLESYKAGHVRPFIGVAKPWEQLAKGNPLKFAGEMVGMEFQDTAFWFPVADLTAGALDALKLGGLQRQAGEMVAREGLRMGERIAAEKATYASMKEAARRGGLPAWQAVMGIEGMRVLIGAQDEHLARDLGLDIFTPGSLEREFRSIHYLTDKQSLSVQEYAEQFERFKEDRIARVAGVFKHMDAESMRRRALSMNIAAGTLDDMTGPVAEAQAIGMLDQTTSEAAMAQLRKIQDVFRIRSLQLDMHSPGNGLAARSSLTNLLARTMNHNMRAVLKKGYVNRGGREMVDEVIRTVIDHPGLWELRDGRYFLTGSLQDIGDADAAVLADVLKRAAGGTKTAGLEKHLREEGLDPEVSFMVTHMGRAYESVGKSLVDQRIVSGLRSDYSARVFKPNAKYKQALGRGEDLPSVYAKIFSQDAEGQTFERLYGMSYRDAMEDAKSGKMTFAEHRRLTEAELVTLEQKGYGEYEKSSTILFSAYMSAAGHAVLFSRLFRDLPIISGDVTRAAVTGRWGEEAAAQLSYKGIKRVLSEEPPAAWKPYFREITSAPMGELDQAKTELVLAKARMSQLSAMHRSADWQAGVAKEGERIKGEAEKLSLGHIKGGIDVIKEADDAIGVLEKAVADVRAAGDRAVAEDVRAGVRGISKSERRITEAYNKAQVAWNKAQARITELQDKALQMELDIEELARQRVAKSLAGKTSVGGFKVRLNGQDAAFDPEWLISGKYPEGLVSARQLKKAADGELQRELATVIKDTQAGKYAESRAKVLAEIEKLKTKSDDVVKRANEALDSHLEKVAAAEKAAGKTAEAAERSVKAVEKRMQRLIPDADMARVKKRMERRLAVFEDAYEKTRAIEQQSRTLGKWTMRSRLARLRSEAAQEIAEGSKITRKAGKVWVFEPDYGHLQEAFKLYEQGKNSQFWEAYDKWNYRLKGLVLLGDVFHFNVLAISQFLTAPEKAFKMLMDDAGGFKPGVEAGMDFWRPSKNVAVGAIAGAGVGAMVSGMRGGDPSETTGFSLAGALYGMTITAALKNSREALRYAMNPENVDTLLMMGLGGWSGRPDDRSIGVLNAGMKALRDRLARDPTNKFLTDPVDKVRHVLDWWDDTLWETLHNGSKHYYFSVIYPKKLAELEASEAWSEAALRQEFKRLRDIPEAVPADRPASESRMTMSTEQRKNYNRALERSIEDHGELALDDEFERAWKRSLPLGTAPPPNADAAFSGWTDGYWTAHEMARQMGIDLKVAEKHQGWFGIFHPQTPDVVWIAPPDYKQLVNAVGRENLAYSPEVAKNLAATSVLFTAGHEVIHSIAAQHPGMEAKLTEWALKSADTEDIAKVAKKISEQWGMAGYTSTMVTQARNQTAKKLASSSGSAPSHEVFTVLRDELMKLQTGERIDQHSLLGQMVTKAVQQAKGEAPGGKAGMGALLKYADQITDPSDVQSIVTTMVNRALEEGMADSGGSYLLKENFWKIVEKDASPEEKGVLMRIVDSILDAIKKVLGGGFGGFSTHAPGAHPGQPVRKAFDEIAEQLITYRRQYLASGLEELGDDAVKGDAMKSFFRGVTPAQPEQPVGIELNKNTKVQSALSRAFRELGWLEAGRTGLIMGPGTRYYSPTGAVRLVGTTLVVDAAPDKLGDVFDFLSHLEEKGGAQAKRLADVVNYVVNRQSIIDAVGHPEWVSVKKLDDGTPVAVVRVGNKERPAIFKQGKAAEEKVQKGGARVAGRGRGGDEVQDEEGINAALEYLQEQARAVAEADMGVVSKGRKALTRAHEDAAELLQPVIEKAVSQLSPELQDAWAHMGPKELGGQDLAPIAYGTLRQLAGGNREVARVEANRRLYTAYVALQGGIAKDLAGSGIPLRPPAFNPGMRPPTPKVPIKGLNENEFSEFVRTRRWQMKTDVARQVVQASNVAFGGETWRFLLDNPQFQTIARRVLLSPDWTGSRLAMSANMLMNMDPMKRALMGAGVGQAVEYADAGGDPEKAFSGRGPVFGAGMALALGKWADGIARRMQTRGDVMAKEARRMAGAALVGGYVMANALNLAFTGRWLFENPEGKRTSIDIGQGDYVSLGKPWVETFEFGGFYEKEHYPIPVISRLASKQSVLPLQYVRLFSNSNAFGGPIIAGDDTAVDISRKAFNFTLNTASPIIFQGPVRFAASHLSGEPLGGDISTALLSSAGFRVSTPRTSGGVENIGALLAGSTGPIRDLPINLGKQ